MPGEREGSTHTGYTLRKYVVCLSNFSLSKEHVKNNLSHSITMENIVSHFITEEKNIGVQQFSSIFFSIDIFKCVIESS